MSNLAKGLQITIQAWAISKDNEDNDLFEIEVLLSRDELDSLSEVCRRVVEADDRRKDITGKFPMLIASSIAGVTGDQFHETDESLGSYLQRSLKLPFRSRLLAKRKWRPSAKGIARSALICAEVFGTCGRWLRC